RAPTNSTGLVDVQAGAQLNAVGTNSYIAMVAPRIQQAGTVSAERSVGYIAAEQADLTINAGLFDISILAGTTDANGIVHTGTTTGTASTSGSDVKTISFVALPKTTALTMLLSGSIGYAPAADAFNDGSAVVLSSGYTTPQPTAEAAGSLGNISIDNASFTNPLTAYASGELDITAANGPVSFGGYADLYAQDALNITLGAGEQFSSSGYGLFLNAGRAATGGSVDISLGSGAVFSIDGYVDIYASNSYAPFALASAPIAKGGQVTIDANGGAFTATDLYADADGSGQYDPAIAAPATGGTVSLTARNGGSITATSLYAEADGFGGYTDTVGGDATGGSISLISQSGVLDVGSVYLDAEGLPSYGTVKSGAATGGTATISLTGGTYNWDSLTAYTTAFAGYTAGSEGSSATVPANSVALTLDNNATLAVANDINLDASALATVDGPAGTNAQAGGITIDVGAGSSLKFTNLSASAEGGIDASPLFDPVTPTLTPDVTGGTINFTAAGQVTGSSIILLADAAEFGASSTSGTATGGKIDMLVNNGGDVMLDDGDGTALLDLDAEGLGAVGASPANAIGGSATLSLADGTVNVAGTVTADASAQWHQESFFYPSGPDPLTGFNAEGGLATVELLPGVAGTSSL
ncbi:MAG TPA: hypothetical protein VFX03_16320, partial [Thermomicrobiales bacterium]|nr:hypothetical protein [Thermomicrobiales bacterium]